MEKIYLDYASTSPMHPEVIQNMTEAFSEYVGNASSIHQFGQKSRGRLDRARRAISKSINAKPVEVVFTSGGTESDNMAIFQCARAHQNKGKHIITTAIEHPAVLRPLEKLESEGFKVTYLPVDSKGEVTTQQVEAAITSETILVTIMYGNNEIGSIMPIQSIGRMLNENYSHIIFHTDAVQAYGIESIDVKECHLDMLSVSAHKINGPKGVGCLYINENIHLPAMLVGGNQEMKKRAGTENLPAIIGFDKAVEITQRDQSDRKKRYTAWKIVLLEELKKANIDVRVNGTLDNKLAHILSIHLVGTAAEKLIIQLDLNGIAVSVGSACTAGSPEPSHVLQALHGQNGTAVHESLRISMGLNTKESDILYLAKKIIQLTKK
ncbi:cysteine desulfurase family protein [Lacticigenium naphthae]|uniref:cysteine desulfurase family protein n=1 Tax=Lacticigenium naphthae TaxID=515351 RepID=UPI00041F2CFB|nr:cysteine desulfurase family protein [Lacticigenium naphthae]